MKIIFLTSEQEDELRDHLKVLEKHGAKLLLIPPTLISNSADKAGFSLRVIVPALRRLLKLK